MEELSEPASLSLSAQRTAVKQRPHQETRRHQLATSEPVVLHHGREGGGAGHDEVRPSVFNGLLGGVPIAPLDLGASPKLSENFVSVLS
jgi:hypothetical protein